MTYSNPNLNVQINKLSLGALAPFFCGRRSISYLLLLEANISLLHLQLQVRGNRLLSNTIR